MTKTLTHELRTFQRAGAMGGWFATCTCGWLGKDRQSRTAAGVDGKTHRLVTAAADDDNRREQ